VSRVLGLVPARGGSKGLPDKNLRPLAGRSLVARAAETALASGVLDRVVLSTDSAALADAGRAAGLEVPFLRPGTLAADTAPMLGFIEHARAALACEGWVADFVVLLPPPSPLRPPSPVRAAVALLPARGADSVVTVVEVPRHLSPDYLMRLDGGLLVPFLPEGARVARRQDARPAYAREGTVYACWRRTIERWGSLYGERCQPLVLDPAESLSIDTADDWAAAERRLGQA
jgi:CMP-N-acetylneuraminic acid synthetase